MKDFLQLARIVEEIAQTEKTMNQQLDRLEEDAASAEKSATPEFGRILLLHADIMRGMLEVSRRRWIRLSKLLSAALALCLLLLAWATLTSR